jgi:hypothetical protein
MIPIKLKPILQRHIVPMFTGSTLSEREEKPAWKKQRVFLENVSNMIVRASEGSNQCFVLRRSQPFDQTDAEFVRGFVEQLHKLGEAEKEYVDDLINPIIRRTVAGRVAPVVSFPNGGTAWPAAIISRLLAKFESWAEQTYEGRRIAAAVGVDAGNIVPSGVKLLEVFGKQFGVVVANGLESFLTADGNGTIVGYEPANNVPGNAKLFAPLKFCCLANWASRRRVGLGLNRNGEILVFADRNLVFAKRRGNWRHFTHRAIVQRMSMQTSFHSRVCDAVYQTCLDVSFAKTGGGIALIKRLEFEKLLQAKIVGENDFVWANSIKGQFLNTITGKPFYDLDRQLRQDIVAMDGATILDYEGKIIAAGAIVNVEAGSDGGGRLAAAKKLGDYGQAIKISSDGEIRGFKQKKNQPGVEEFFTVG